MTIPHVVSIGPHEVTVDMSAETGRLLHEENACGDSRPDRLLIRLAVDRPHTAVAETLLHELLHVALSLVPHDMDEDEEEVTVKGLAPWLLGILRDNPALVTWLTEGDDVEVPF